MAKSDLLLKDQSATPASFAPESSDQGTNAAGTTIKRPMYGKADGADATLGTTTDPAPANPTVAGSVVAKLSGIWNALLGLLTVDTVVKAAATSRSGTIAAGGTAQVLMPANATRRGFSIQNQSTAALYFNAVANATADNNSLVLQPGDYFESSVHHVGTGAVSIIGATTGQAFYAREF